MTCLVVCAQNAKCYIQQHNCNPEKSGQGSNSTLQLYTYTYVGRYLSIVFKRSSTASIYKFNQPLTCLYSTLSSCSNVAVKQSSSRLDSSSTTVSICVDWLNAYFQGAVNNSDIPLPPICHLNIPNKTGKKLVMVLFS